MAKRFTDTDKWKREWFCDLDPKAKLVWLYLLDQCDHCGIWPRNFGLLSQQVGFKVDEAQFLIWFEGKLIKFDLDKYFIPSFFEFQYGSSKEGFKAKQSALSTLSKLGLIGDDGSFRNSSEHFGKCPEHLHNTSGQSMDCPSIGISTSIGISNKGGVGEKLPDLAIAWNEHCGTLPKVRSIDKKREKAIRERIAEASLDEWITTIHRVRDSKFCNGGGNTGWIADFDWLIKPGTGIRIMEGKYDDRSNMIAKESGNFLVVADQFFQVVKKWGPDDRDKIQEFLGPDKFRLFVKIGRQRIGSMPDNEFSRKALANQIKEIAGEGACA